MVGGVTNHDVATVSIQEEALSESPAAHQSLVSLTILFFLLSSIRRRVIAVLDVDLHLLRLAKLDSFLSCRWLLRCLSLFDLARRNGDQIVQAVLANVGKIVGLSGGGQFSHDCRRL